MQLLYASLFSIGSGEQYCYDRFPANIRTEEQEEKRKQILSAAIGAVEYPGKYAVRYNIRERESSVLSLDVFACSFSLSVVLLNLCVVLLHPVLVKILSLRA